ncbi:MAG TPA: rhodanese-like domain-containing protein [Nitrospira sp.]|jgi:phage shock protein E
MIRRTAMTLVCMLLIAGLTTVVSAHHSYLLSVQQLRAGINKAPSMAQKGFVLIDVRSPEEHAAGFIPGTDLNIDFREIKTRHREIGVPLDEHVVVYCQSGRRSNIAAETLADLGYTHVYNVQGSLNAWVEAGYPVTR